MHQQASISGSKSFGVISSCSAPSSSFNKLIHVSVKCCGTSGWCDAFAAKGCQFDPWRSAPFHTVGPRQKAVLACFSPTLNLNTFFIPDNTTRNRIREQCGSLLRQHKNTMGTNVWRTYAQLGVSALSGAVITHILHWFSQQKKVIELENQHNFDKKKNTTSLIFIGFLWQESTFIRTANGDDASNVYNTLVQEQVRAFRFSKGQRTI